MKLSVGIGDTLCTCMFQAWRAYDDGRNGALLNSDGCSVAGARVECCTCREKRLQRTLGDCCCLAQKYVGVVLFFELPL